jgi:NADH dehydrogenase (ubiquinone) 1 alpha subcomplex subunit 9
MQATPYGVVPQRLSSSEAAAKHSGVAPFRGRYGLGGRSSNSGITATVFGAYGFVGRYFINELGACGSRVYVPFRGCEMEPRHLKPMFDLGQVRACRFLFGLHTVTFFIPSHSHSSPLKYSPQQLGLLPFSPRDHDSIREAIKNSDVVINMIGKHYETKHIVPTRRADGKLSRVNYSFDEVNNEIARTLAKLSKEAGVQSFIHMSALAADLESGSVWAQTKAKGEVAVREEFPNAIIVKPATIFGAEDRFLTWIAEACDRLPVFPLINGGKTLVQPVYSLDVGKALMTLVNNHSTYAGATVQLCGPAEYTYKEVVEFVTDVTTVKKPLVDVPESAALFAGRFIQETVTPILTEDHVAQLKEDVVAVEGSSMLTMQDLGIEPQSMDKVAFDFLHRFRPGGHFTLVGGYH